LDGAESTTSLVYLLLKGFKPSEELIDFGDKFLFALDSEGLSSAFQESVLLFPGFFEHTHACLLGLFNKGPDCCVVFTKLVFYDLQVFIETVFELMQAFVDLGLYLFLKSVCEDLVALFSVFVSIKDGVFKVEDLVLKSLF